MSPEPRNVLPLVAGLVFLWLQTAAAAPIAAPIAAPVAIVAAENFYGDIASQIGGDRVIVTSILTNPSQDPHDFEASASTAKTLSAAQLVLYNGAGYDGWMTKLLKAAKKGTKGKVPPKNSSESDGEGEPVVLVVADLVRWQPKDNPHLWYRPDTCLMVARAVAARLQALDPDHTAEYGARLAQFEASLDPIFAKIAAMNQKYAKTPVTATEPVFGEMAEALGLAVQDQAFQTAIMNGVEPGAGVVAAFEQGLRQRRVRLLFYNLQTSGGIADRMLALAKAQRIPVVGVSESKPEGLSYQKWLNQTLDQVAVALNSFTP